jgi:hypothetical protein
MASHVSPQAGSALSFPEAPSRGHHLSRALLEAIGDQVIALCEDVRVFRVVSAVRCVHAPERHDIAPVHGSVQRSDAVVLFEDPQVLRGYRVWLP